MNDVLKRALEYVRNTDGNATVDDFDVDNEPAGPMLRRQIMPVFVMEDGNGKLILTDAGRNELQ